MYRAPTTNTFGKGLNWVLFDMIFKPLAVSSIVVLERWFSHRVPYISSKSQAAITAAELTAVKRLGPTLPALVMAKLVSLFMHFLETDNAYMNWFEDFFKEYTRRRKEVLI